MSYSHKLLYCVYHQIADGKKREDIYIFFKQESKKLYILCFAVFLEGTRTARGHDGCSSHERRLESKTNLFRKMLYVEQAPLEMSQLAMPRTVRVVSMFQEWPIALGACTSPRCKYRRALLCLTETRSSRVVTER